MERRGLQLPAAALTAVAALLQPASAGRDSALLRVRGSGLQVGGVNVGGALMREMPGPSHSYLSVHRVAVCI